MQTFSKILINLKVLNPCIVTGGVDPDSKHPRYVDIHQ